MTKLAFSPIIPSLQIQQVFVEAEVLQIKNALKNPLHEQYPDPLCFRQSKDFFFNCNVTIHGENKLS